MLRIFDIVFERFYSSCLTTLLLSIVYNSLPIKGQISCHLLSDASELTWISEKDMAQSLMLYICILDLKQTGTIRNDSDRKVKDVKNPVKTVHFLVSRKFRRQIAGMRE